MIIYVPSGILLSNKKEKSYNICYNMNKLQNTMLSKTNFVQISRDYALPFIL